MPKEKIINATTARLMEDMKLLLCEYIDKRIQEEGGKEDEVLIEINGILLSNLIICFSIFTSSVTDEDADKIAEEYLEWISDIFKTFYKGVRKDIKDIKDKLDEDKKNLEETAKKFDLYMKIHKDKGSLLS